MKNRTIEKLRSRSGASITAALLVFLACAVLSSVVIAAATAASGRMSRIAEADQRYYAVTSAAGLLKDLIHGKTVLVVEETETTYTTTYSGGVAEEPVGVMRTKSSYIVPDQEAGQAPKKWKEETRTWNQGTKQWELVSEKTELTLAYQAETIPEDAAKRLYVSAAEGTTLSNRSLTLSTGFYVDVEPDYDYALAVSITEELDADGTLKLTLYNTYQAKDEPSAAGSRYTLVMTFGADRSESTSTKTETVSSTALSDSEYRVETKVTETTTTTLTWRLNGIKTNG